MKLKNTTYEFLIKRNDVNQDLGWVNVEDLATLSKTLAGELLTPPIDDTTESNTAPNPLPNQLELPF